MDVNIKEVTEKLHVFYKEAADTQADLLPEKLSAVPADGLEALIEVARKLLSLHDFYQSHQLTIEMMKGWKT